MSSEKSSVKLFNGYSMPLVGLGTWQSTEEEELEKALEVAIDAGYRHIDTAFLYENEHIIGKTLKKLFDSGKVQRSDLFIVSKLPPHGMREEYVEYFFKKSLSALQLDYLDLYLLHSSMAVKKSADTDEATYFEDGKYQSDPEVDLIETWKKMETLVDKKLVRSIGLSNFNSKQIQRIVDNSQIKPANLQVECHLYLPQLELQEFCKKLNIAFTAYSPLGTPGMPAYVQKKWGMAMDVPNLLTDPILVQMAEKHKKTAAQVALRFLVQRDIVVIPKSANPQRIKENVEIFDFELSDKDMEQLKTSMKAHRYFTSDYYPGMKEHPEFPFAEPF